MKAYDLIVVGGGSGGIGAALAAGRLGLRVLLLEKQNYLGGNAAQSGVSVWEMGVGGTGIPFDIYKRLKQKDKAVGIYSFAKHRKWQLQSGESPLHPGAELLLDPSKKYRDTLLRHGSETGILNEAFVREYWHGVPFEPAIYQQVVEEMLLETGNVTVLKNTAFQAVESSNGVVASVTLSNGETVSAPLFIDATDSGHLCRYLGCETMFGQEANDVFNEPGAPENASSRINGVSLIYRIGLREKDEANSLDQELESNVPCWWAESYPVASIVQYPNGDLNVNMLPTMEGVDFVQYADYQASYEECKRRVLAHFRHLKSTYAPYADYKLLWMAPALGVREGHRVVTQQILTEQDIRGGLVQQLGEPIVTIADHALDTHGKSTGRAGCAELDMPYGVPYPCLVPKGFSNLLIASRAAGFSSLAASSCRLSRTMMQLGQAAGTAAYIALRDSVDFPNVGYADLSASLVAHHVQLEYPAPAELEAYLEME
ncbi:FAD-dependent oxidoreductase [Dyadobacter sp. CY323]|uniref:FAD-dependent oxidoreductase n=1 Tax=Dyadobacter sp. CY323 TaxID=2907302 RepID=UPI001F398DCE|nr:FAD-dependent oxidoreductase [Dyadobacter sp. CY323]MCE6991834.1 FAD-dependent oxidoreductase [Dyadobacter sp. CY323]